MPNDRDPWNPMEFLGWVLLGVPVAVLGAGILFALGYLVIAFVLYAPWWMTTIALLLLSALIEVTILDRID